MNTKKETLLNDNQTYDFYAWPGGYPRYFITLPDNGVLCAKCANDNVHLTIDDFDNVQWFIVAKDVNWEDEELMCDNCYQSVESAYGRKDGE